MSITTSPTANKAILNSGIPSSVMSILQAVGLGNMLRALHTFRRGVAPVAAGVNPYVVAAAQAITLPEDAKAAILVKAYARAGAGTKGPLVIDASTDSFGGAAPAAGHIAIAPNGDIVLNAADAWTAIDFVYEPEKYDIVEQTLTVASNAVTLPTVQGKALFLLEVEALVGTSTGKKIVDVPGTAPAAGHAALDLAKAVVNFQATDAVTSARVKYGVYSAIDADAVLEAQSTTP